MRLTKWSEILAESSSAKPKLVFIVGPTATGKSKLAIDLTLALTKQAKFEIINCDSVQVYEGVDIGTAKPSRDEQNKVPHHMLSFVKAPQTYTAGLFENDTLELIRRKAMQGCREFFVVGGSGFYVQALTNGMYDFGAVPEDVRAKLQTDLESNGLEKLFAEISERDPAYTKGISSQDRYRILRGLELIRGFGIAPSEARKQFKARENLRKAEFECIKIGLTVDRAELRKRVQIRTHKMLNEGLIAEVEALKSKGLSDWAPMRSVGYKEAQSFLDGKLNRADLASLIETSTMQLAKRQSTWFRRDPEIKWFDAADLSDTQARTLEWLTVSGFLSKTGI